jgi:hypothetical protein
VERPGGDRRQITFFPEPVTGATFPEQPDGRTFYFLKDVGGGEFYQLFSFDLNTVAYTLLTDGKSRNSEPEFANGSNQFVFTSTRRNRKDYDFYLADAQNPGQAKLLREKRRVVVGPRLVARRPAGAGVQLPVGERKLPAPARRPDRAALRR